MIQEQKKWLHEIETNIEVNIFKRDLFDHTNFFQTSNILAQHSFLITYQQQHLDCPIEQQ